MTPEWFYRCPDPLAWHLRLEEGSSDARPETGCIEWTGELDADGYGIFYVTRRGVRTNTSAHRAAWLARVGPLADGLVVDHLCRNHSCLRIEHLEPVTNAENVRRGFVSRGAAKQKDPHPPASRRQVGISYNGTAEERRVDLLESLERYTSGRKLDAAS